MTFNKNEILKLLEGGDLRSLALVDELVAHHPAEANIVDLLVELMFKTDRLVAMRAADALEKMTKDKPELLQAHQSQLLANLTKNLPIEIRWHLALLAPRFKLDAAERQKIQTLLTEWIMNRRESRLVRVHALQGLFELRRNAADDVNFLNTLDQLGDQEVPAMVARMRQLRKKIEHS